MLYSSYKSEVGMENKKTKMPKVFLILGLVSLILLAVGVSLIIIGAIQKVPEMGETGWFEAETTKSNFIFGGSVCLGFGLVLLISSFTPLFHKVSVKTTKYIMSETKEDLTEIADMSADIASPIITKTVGAVKEEFRDTKYCKHCGAKIDEDSKYCSECGKRQ